MAAQSKWYLSERLKSQPDVICPKIALHIPHGTQTRCWPEAVVDAGASAKPWILITVIAVMDKSPKVKDAHRIVIFFVLDCGISMGQS